MKSFDYWPMANLAAEPRWQRDLDLRDEALKSLTPEAVVIARRLLWSGFETQLGFCVLGDNVTIDFGDGETIRGRMKVAIPIPCKELRKFPSKDILYWFAAFQKFSVNMTKPDPLPNGCWTVQYGAVDYRKGEGVGRTLSDAIVEAELNLSLWEAHV
jgi:hypothetical protein